MKTRVDTAEYLRQANLRVEAYEHAKYSIISLIKYLKNVGFTDRQMRAVLIPFLVECLSDEEFFLNEQAELLGEKKTKIKPLAWAAQGQRTTGQYRKEADSYVYCSTK